MPRTSVFAMRRNYRVFPRSRQSLLFQPDKVQPLAAHVVVGDKALTGGTGDDFGAWFDRLAWRGCAVCQAVFPRHQLVEDRAVFATGGVEHRLAVDAISLQYVPPALEIPGDG